MFRKHHLLQGDAGGGSFPANAIANAKKGVTYYFCPQAPTRYKRVTTNITAGCYEPPAVYLLLWMAIRVSG